MALGGRTQYFNDLNQMINATFAHEQRTALDHLKEDAANRPNVNHRGVMSCSEDEFRRPVASRTDIGQIGLMS